MTKYWNWIRKLTEKQEKTQETVPAAQPEQQKQDPPKPAERAPLLKNVCLKITAPISDEAKKMPWTEPMVPKAIGAGPGLDYPGSRYGSTKLEWVSEESGAVREPEEKTFTCHVTESFPLLGKQYRDVRSILSVLDESQNWGRDVYGRQVLYIRERFPCFDSYDYANEHRYFHWFFLCQDGKLARIQYTDERDVLYITEDVACVENKCWRNMEELGYFK